MSNCDIENIKKEVCLQQKGPKMMLQKLICFPFKVLTLKDK